MNYTQNEKIEQVTDSTMVVGVDIGSQIHYARAFDNRGRELTKRIFSFHNDLEGFNSFNLWAETLKTENKKTAVLIGCEPTGHYWFAFAKYVNDHQKRLVMVNPFSVKKIKELDDNSPKKTDSKDPKTIAKLVVDGRYSIPYMPEGIYAEIRDLVYSRDRIMKQHNISANRIQRWLAIHFPEYLGLYTRFDAISGLAVLEKAPLPKDVIALGVNGIRKIWHDKKMRGRGVTEDRAKTLVEAAHNSVGLDGGIGTKSELYMLLEEHRLWTSQLEAVNKVLEEMILKVPHVSEFKYGVGEDDKKGKLYLSVILDLCDRRPVAFVYSTRNDNPLVFDTFDKAVAANPGATPLLHSDRGYQYTSKAFRRRILAAGMTQSMSRVARCIDNGPMEGFWGLMKREMYYGKKYKTKEELIYLCIGIIQVHIQQR